MNNPYMQKLKDPRWQKKRLEIMQRDNFTCQLCGDTKETLVVHHYKYAGDPWGVDDEYLITLCQDCHDSEHALIKETKPLLLDTMADLPADSYRAVASIIDYLKNNSEVPPSIAIDILGS